MKKSKLLGLCFLFIGFSCSDDADDQVQKVDLTFNFSHSWDGEAVSNSDFNEIKYTNANGEEMSITLLRYLISDITFEKSTGETFVLDGYNLVDVTNDTGLSWPINGVVPAGDYSKVSFTFGFDNEDNVDGAYQDLNSVTWNVPMLLGGGYHYMQLEGRFINSNSEEEGYQYHAIRAVDITGDAPVFQDTFFEVDLGAMTLSENATISVDMNIAEWFKNPNQWDLNELGSMLMPNFNAQVLISQNGQGVFQLIE